MKTAREKAHTEETLPGYASGIFHSKTRAVPRYLDEYALPRPLDVRVNVHDMGHSHVDGKLCGTPMLRHYKNGLVDSNDRPTVAV